MAIDITFVPAQPNNPFEIARRSLISAIARMPVPAAIGSFPEPADFEAVGTHIRAAAELFDAWLADIGAQVKANASSRVDLRQFDGAFLGAVDGNATYEVEQLAEIMRDEIRQVA